MATSSIKYLQLQVPYLQLSPDKTMSRAHLETFVAHKDTCVTAHTSWVMPIVLCHNHCRETGEQTEG